MQLTVSRACVLILIVVAGLYGKPHLKFKRQNTNSWCWAAASEMLMDSHGFGDIKQCKQVTEYVSRYPQQGVDASCCGSKSCDGVKGGLTLRLYGHDYDTPVGPLSWDDIRKQIDNNGTYASFWAADDLHRLHYFVVYGYVNLLELVKVADPAFGKMWMPRDLYEDWFVYGKHGTDYINIR
jgi:hypothetical protein